LGHALILDKIFKYSKADMEALSEAYKAIGIHLNRNKTFTAIYNKSAENPHRVTKILLNSRTDKF
jgi:hypothetical protein